MISYPATVIVTLGIVALLHANAMRVGRARRRWSISPPAVHGHPEFERIYRIQMNTLECAVPFLPALWLCALFAGDVWAGSYGALWLAARIAYAFAYVHQERWRVAAYGLTVSALVLSVATTMVVLAVSFGASALH